MPHHRFARVFYDPRRIRVGVFGGSFNPAHQGHSAIADSAVKNLRLDALWWLVSPQNPLKDTVEMADFAVRFDSALVQAQNCRWAKKMLVSPLEYQQATPHTAKTAHFLRQRMPHAALIWVMGADSLMGFHRWYRPQMIADSVAIAVINRPYCSYPALVSRGAKIAGKRLPQRRLARKTLPRSWCFIHGVMNPLSSTAVRTNKIKSKNKLSFACPTR